MDETWKDIPGYVGLYQVSDLGNVKSVARTIWNGRGFGAVKERLLKSFTEYDGYLDVTLSKYNIPKIFKVHRLVLLAFVGPSNLQCNHKNGVKSDNRLENLEWVTPKENIQHGWKMGVFSSQKNGLAHKGKHFTEAAKEKMRSARLRYYQRRRDNEW